MLLCKNRSFIRSQLIEKIVKNAVLIIGRQNTLKKYLSFEIDSYNFVASVVFGLILGHAPEKQRRTMAKVT